MEDKTIKTIVNAISLLITPNVTSSQSSGQKEILLEVLFHNVKKVEEYLDANNLKVEFQNIAIGEVKSDNGNIDLFLNINQRLLIFLKEHLLQEQGISTPAEGALKGILSIQQQKVVSTAVELIVSFGIISNFVNGIGIPISKRSNYGNLIKFSGSRLQRYLMLSQCTCTLLNCKDHQDFQQIINRHTSDLLASLLQLAYVPLNEVFPSEDELTDDLKPSFYNTKKEMSMKLIKFLNELPQSTIIKEILILKGCNPIATPIWFRKISSKYLSQELVKQHGVQCVISAVLGNELCDENDKDGAYYWQKCDVVGKIVVGSRLPNQPPNEYFKHVFPQINELLHNEAKDSRMYILVAVNVFGKATEHCAEFAQKYLWTPLLQPLFCCSEEKTHADCTCITESKLTQCINDLFQLFFLTTNLPDAMCDYLTSVIGIIFNIYVFSQSTVTNLRSQLQSLMITYMKHSDEIRRIKLFRRLLFDSNEDDSKVLSWNHNLKIEVGSNGGLCVTPKKENDEFSWMNDISSMADAVIGLLNLLRNDNLVSPFFLMMLQEFTSMQTKFENLKERKNNCSNQKLLIEIEETVAYEQKVMKNLFLMIQLFELMSEDTQLQNLMMDDKIASFKLLKMMFSQAVGKKFNEESFETETLTIAVSLTLILAAKKLSAEEKEQLENLLPILQNLSDHHSNENVRKMIEELRYSILTDGVVAPPKKDSSKKITNFQKLWDELKDPFVPTRGHALIGLRKLIIERDSETLSHADELLDVFHRHVDDDDSYIYLAAVQGLASLTERYPDKIVPRLTAEFANFDTKKRNSVELRLKLGEVIVKVTQLLGEMLPKYRDLFLQAFLNGCKDENSQVRASSLSNLAEVCKGLKFSIGPCIHEVMLCVRSLLKTDAASEVKEACLLLITLLLRGLGDDTFEVIGSILPDLFRLLKTIYTIERDDKVKLNAQLALEELNITAKKFINPKPKIRIFVSFLTLRLQHNLLTFQQSFEVL
uniref:RNA polymerase II assembly factor Rtp1 C-terminal domain-containing protein n=1 Tax=Strigamia maritima TaxID=126957 RepID=T1ISA3_STRMM